MQVKRLYDDGLVDDNKKKLGLAQWKILLQVKKDMSQEKPITLRQQHNKKRRRRDTNSHKTMDKKEIENLVQETNCNEDIYEAMAVSGMLYDLMNM